MTDRIWHYLFLITITMSDMVIVYLFKNKLRQIRYLNVKLQTNFICEFI